MRNILLAILAAASLRAGAQTGRGFVTLEDHAGRAIDIYEGHFTGVQVLPNDRAKATYQVHVDRVLKGEKREEFEYTTDQTGVLLNKGVYEQWIADKTTFLYFYDGHQVAPTEYLEWDFWQLGPTVPAQKIYKSQDPGMLTMDLRTVSDPDKIVEDIAAFSRRHPNKVPEYELGDVPGFVDLPGGSGLYNLVYVPEVDELQDIALRLVRKPESFIDPSTAFRYWPPEARPKLSDFEKSNLLRSGENRLRALGIEALKFFKSGANARLLIPYLKDPDVVTSHYVDLGFERKEYPIRKAAYEVLTGWGEKVEKPVLEEAPVPKSHGGG